jgi:hypothetical protein
MAASADDFISQIGDFSELATPIQCDLLALYLLTEGGATTVSPSSIASLRNALHLPTYSRLSAYLSEQTGGRTGRYVKQKGGYVLERSYAAGLKTQYLGRPVTRNLATGLRGTLSAVSDPAVKLYLEEAIGCFEGGLLRAAIVMSWCVAYGLFRGWLFRSHLAQFNATTATWKVPITIQVLDDFQELTESTVLETARKSGMVSKEEHKILKHLLDGRNSFAHPTTRAMTPAMAEAYIDSVVRDIIPKYG